MKTDGQTSPNKKRKSDGELLHTVYEDNMTRAVERSGSVSFSTSFDSILDETRGLSDDERFKQVKKKISDYMRAHPDDPKVDAWKVSFRIFNAMFADKVAVNEEEDFLVM